VDGWLRVRVAVRTTDMATLRALTTAGLQVETVGDGSVIGLVRPAALAQLAGLDAVTHVEPAIA
jgi:hypothetical protein